MRAAPPCSLFLVALLLTACAGDEAGTADRARAVAPAVEVHTVSLTDGPRSLALSMPEEAWSNRPITDFLAAVPPVSADGVDSAARQARMGFASAFDTAMGDPANPRFAARMEEAWSALAAGTHPMANLQASFDRFIGLEMLRAALNGERG